MKITINLFITFLLLSAHGCVQIENEAWKYCNGFYIGDWIEFDNKVFCLRNDTIFKNQIPVAKVKNYRNRFIDQILTIEKLNDTTKGYYCSKR